MGNRIKSIIHIIVIITVLMLCCSCSSQDKDVLSTVDIFIHGMQRLDFAVIDSCISSSVTEIENSFEGEYYEYIKECCKQIEHENKEVKINGSKAEVILTLSYPDASIVCSKAMQEYINQIREKTLQGESLSEEEKSALLFKLINDFSETTKPEIITAEGEIYLMKIDEKWLIEDVSEEITAALGCNYLAAFNELK